MLLLSSADLSRGDYDLLSPKLTETVYLTMEEETPDLLSVCLTGCSLEGEYLVGGPVILVRGGFRERELPRPE